MNVRAMRYGRPVSLIRADLQPAKLVAATTGILPQIIKGIIPMGFFTVDEEIGEDCSCHCYNDEGLRTAKFEKDWWFCIGAE